MTTVRMDLPTLVQHQQELGRAFKPALNRALISAGKRCLPVLVRSTREAPPANPNGVGQGGAFNTGAYARAWKSTVIPNGVRLFNDSPYAAVIEKGRRAGSRMPPLEAIERWVLRRLRTKAGTYKRGKRAGQEKLRKFGADEDLMKAVALQIARAIARRGLRPRLVMGRVMNQLVQTFTNEIENTLDAALNALGGQ